MTTSFKPFYIHYNADVGSMKCLSAKHRQMRRGFTAKVEPGSTPRTVKVGVTFCSLLDEFIKSSGRAEADAVTKEEINVRQLPAWLADKKKECVYGAWGYVGDYNYVLKYVL